MKLLLQITGQLGHTTINTLTTVVEIVFFLVVVMRRGFEYIYANQHNSVIKNAVATQIIFSGVDSFIPTLLIISVTIGFSVTAQLIMTLQAFGSEKEMINIFIRFVTLQLSPLLTAIIIICRSVSAVAVDLGNMSINREIKGLELLGIDVLVYLAFPRLVGITIAQISLAVYFSVLSLGMGVFFSALLDVSSNFKYFFIFLTSIQPLELLIFLLKNLLFGIVIGASACFHGLRVEGSVTQVPQETQRAIVRSLISVFCINALFVL